MELKAMTFDNSKLSTVTVEMTAEEAAFMVKTAGNMNDPMAAEAFGRSTHAHNEIYDLLAGEVFNRLYDDGVHEWMRQ